MHLAICTALVLAIFTFPTLLKAEDDTAVEKAYLDLAVARTKAELALRKLDKLTNDNRSGWQSGWQKCDEAHETTMNFIRKAINTEEQKPEAERDERLLGEARLQNDTVEREWNRFNQKQRSEIDANHREAAEQAGNLNNIFNNLAGMEGNWKNAGLELAALQRSFDMVTNKVTEVAGKLEKAITDLNAAGAQLEETTTTVKKAITPKKDL